MFKMKSIEHGFSKRHNNIDNKSMHGKCETRKMTEEEKRIYNSNNNNFDIMYSFKNLNYNSKAVKKEIKYLDEKKIKALED